MLLFHSSNSDRQSKSKIIARWSNRRAIRSWLWTPHRSPTAKTSTSKPFFCVLLPIQKHSWYASAVKFTHMLQRWWTNHQAHQQRSPTPWETVFNFQNRVRSNAASALMFTTDIHNEQWMFSLFIICFFHKWTRWCVLLKHGQKTPHKSFAQESNSRSTHSASVRWTWDQQRASTIMQ